MRLTVTGATGLIGSALVSRLRDQGAQLTLLTRDPQRARAALAVDAVHWRPSDEPAPVQALAGRDAVIHLAGENIAQRWGVKAKQAIRQSRVQGTANLLAGLRAAGPAAPSTLISGSAIGYYGPHRDEPLDEDTPAGRGFLAEVCSAWEAQALRARELGLRVVLLRTGVVLDAHGGALAKMLPPFRIGLGGPVGSGKQYVSWIHLEDLAALVEAALRSARWSGPVNATAPEPVSNREFAKALGRVLHRPALLPLPAVALYALYGEMAQVVTTGARVLPAKALVLGYQFRHPQLSEALADTLTER